MKQTRSIFYLAVMSALSFSAPRGHALDNAGFESPDLGAGGWQYNTTGADWTFTPRSGLSGPNGPWRANNPSPDPLGDQFAFLQRATTLSQDLTDLIVGVSYDLSFLEAYRVGTFPSNDLSVVLNDGLADELVIYNTTAVTNATWEARQTDVFVATNTSYTLTFRTTNPLNGLDQTTLIDGVVLNAMDVPGLPTITTLSPTNNAVDVILSADLTATFSEVLLPGSGNITLKNLTDATQTVIPIGDAQVTLSGGTLTINPSSLLTPGKNYAIQMDAGVVTDVATNNFAGISDDTTWSFTTTATDNVPPDVIGLFPADDATAVLVSSNLEITFTEFVQKGSGNLTVKRMSNNAIVEVMDINSSRVTVNDAVATINLVNHLEPNTAYYIEADAGTAEDLFGNPFAGTTGNTAWNFTTHPVGFIPISGDADSGISTNKVYTHAIDFGNNVTHPVATINGVIFADGGTGALPPIAGTSATIGTGSSTLPTSNNGNGVAAPFLSDPGMQNLVGDMIFNDITGEVTLTGLDTGKVYQVRLYNRAWALGATRNQTVGFNTDGVPGVEASTSINEDNATVPDVAFDTPGQVYVLSYNYMPASTNITIHLDRSDTSSGSYHLYGLTNEELPDDVPPVIVSLSPADDAIDFPIYENLTATFDQSIRTGIGNITISNLTDATSIVIPVTDPRISIDELTLTINPDVLLSGLKDYAILIDATALENQFGTPFAGFVNDGSWTFTTAAAETVPPQLTGLTPANGALNVSRHQQLVLTFDEAVQTGSGDITVKRLDDNAILETIAVTSSAVTSSGANVTIEPTIVLDQETAYYVEVPPGAIQDLSTNPFAGIAGNSSWVLTVHDIYFEPITGDADSGITTNKLYTHAIDFGGNTTNFPVATVNGIVFANGSPGAFPPITGTSASVGTGSTTMPATHNGNGGANGFLTDPGMQHLVADFIYNDATAEIELTGLIPGRDYQVRLYNRAWGIGGSREQVIGFSTDGQPGAESMTAFNEDEATLADVFLDTAGRVNAITYTYVPTSTNLLITIDRQGSGTYHLYGLTNEEIVDDVAPTVVSLEPMDNATNVVTYTDLVATFDIPIQAGTGNIIISNVTQGVATTILVSDPQVSIDDIFLSINPTNDLDALDEYAILIDTNALTNPFGTPFVGITNATAWTFTVGEADITAPSIVALDPVNGENAAAILSDFTFQVDEPVVAATGSITLRQLGDDLAVEIFDVTSNAVIINGTNITLIRSVLLDPQTPYYVEIDAGAFADPAGNPLPGITGNADWRFTTTVTGTLAYTPITGDADSGISTNNTYTHVLDFGQGTPGALVNGVQFAAYNNAANGTLDFNRTVSTGSPVDHGGNGGHNVTGGLVELLTDMYYNNGISSGGTTTWTLSGLTPGLNYETRIYVRQWAPNASRLATLFFDPDGAGPMLDATDVISEDDATSVGMATANQAYFISYAFTAGADGELVITANQQVAGNSWHLYGLSNQVAGSPEPFIFTDITYTGGATPSASFSFNSLPGKTYRIEAKLNLSDANWIELADEYASGGLMTTFVDTVAAGMPRVYYRVRENP